MAQKIYTHIVMDWDFEVLESESFLYDGPVALCWGGKAGGADSEAGGDAGRGEGRNGGGPGSSGGSERGGGGNFGGISYGGVHSGGLGLGGISSAVAETVGRESFGGLAGSSRGSERGGSEQSNAPSFGSADASFSRSVHASAPDMSSQISGLTGKQVTRTDAGYVDDTGTRMAYSSGEPTSFGAHATAREQNLGQSWAGAKAMSSMAGYARHDARKTRAREIQERVTKDLQDPFGLNVDPHMAKAAYDDAMHGMYDKAVAVGAMTPQEVADVQSAYSSPMDAVGKALGFGPPKDVTTPYEKSVTAIAAGLVDPKTGKLTAKGWANVAAPALGMLAGPLAGLGMSVAGIPGAIAGALAPTVANAYASSGVPTSKASTVVGETAAAFGLNAAPVAAGVAYGSVMDTMAGAQNYAGTQPESVAGMDSNREGASQFESMFSGFFTRKSSNKRSSESESNVNPAFKAAREGKSSTTSTAQTTAPVVPSAVTAVNFDSIFSGFFTRG